MIILKGKIAIPGPHIPWVVFSGFCLKIHVIQKFIVKTYDVMIALKKLRLQEVSPYVVILC
jgi:hypothetical protein